MKDHYRILGVRHTASPTEIRKAYRALALKYHPDKNPGSSVAADRFREINESYVVLSDAAKRAAYDDERWLAGMGGKKDPVIEVTPAWLQKVCIDLNTSLAAMDTHRMSQRTLQSYILLILANEHISILQVFNDRQANRFIITEILKAVRRLEVRYLDEIEQRLVTIAGDDEEMLDAIDEKIEDRKRNAVFEQYLPYFVILITIALCVCMYYYAGNR